MARDIKLQIGGNITKVQAALAELKRSGKDAAGSLDRDFKGLSGGSERLIGSFKLLSGVLGGLSLASVAKDVFNTSREFQTLRASLTTATGSVEAAGSAFADLQGFAASTPYQLQEVVTAFIKLKNLGLDPSQDALRSYGNTASSMGKSLDQMIEAVADAATGEFERLKEFGIKARQQGDQVTLTFRGVKTTIGNNSQEITAYLQKLGDTEFAGGMERQMKTLDGQVSNLKDSWDALMNAIGEAGAAGGSASVISQLTNEVQRLGAAVALFGAYKEGKIGFFEWMTSGPDDAARLVKELKDVDGTLEQLKQKVADLQSDKAGNFWWSAADEERLQAAKNQLEWYKLELGDIARLKGAAMSNSLEGRDKDLTYYEPTAAQIARGQAQGPRPLATAPSPKSVSPTEWAGPFGPRQTANAQLAADLGERLQALREALMTEEEAIESSYQKRLATIAQLRQSDLASKDDLDQLEIKAAEEKDKKLTEIAQRGNEERMRSAVSAANVIAGSTAQLFGTLAASQDQSSREGFKKYKEFSKAQAGISTALAVLNAMSTVQPWYAAVAASIVAGAMGAVQIAKIDSMEYQGARAAGGRTRGGETYLVGERGPELLTMGEDGFITPNDQIQGGGAMQQKIDVTNVFNISTGVNAVFQAEFYRMLPVIKQQSVQAVQEAMNRGGSMSRAVRRRS